MKIRKIHKMIGLILVLPMLGWVMTGLIFFIKPGYSGAYEQLMLKTYPLEQSFDVLSSSNWKEARLVKTILGHHLLIRTQEESKHLDPTSLLPIETPSDSDIKLLLEDAISNNQDRYGKIIKIENQVAYTNTGIEIKLNWKNLSLYQTGNDTKLINLLYKIHYLQWSPYKSVNQILGILGLLLLISLTILGIRIYIKGRR